LHTSTQAESLLLNIRNFGALIDAH